MQAKTFRGTSPTREALTRKPKTYKIHAMDFTRNLLIIGAGAHQPYDLPTSKSLKEMMKALYRFNAQSEFRDATKHTPVAERQFDRLIKLSQQFDSPRHLVPIEGNSQRPDRARNLIGRFLKSFCDSSASSIDTFLAAHVDDWEMVTVGKLVVAYLIQQAETNTPLGERKDEVVRVIGRV